MSVVALARRALAGALGAGLVTVAGDVRPVSGPAVSPSPFPVHRRLLNGVSAELADRDGSGGASPGDEVVLWLRRPLAPGRTVHLEDLPLASSRDRWGVGAWLSVGAVGKEDEVQVTLGEAPALSLYETYLPGRADSTVARVLTKNGPIPILVRPADRRSFVGDRFPDSPRLKAYFGQLHSHTSVSDGELEPPDAFRMARAWGLDFFAVTDHLEQLTASSWERGLRSADEEEVPGAFVALYGYEWGGYPTLWGWMNHVNVVGSDQLLSLIGTTTLRGLYEGILSLPGPSVVGQFNHPGMRKPGIGRNNWDDFAYQPDADLRMTQILVETRSASRETVGMIPALDRGWHVGPKAEEDNHRASWGRSRVRTGLWIPELTRLDVLAGLRRMATFTTDDPGASLKLTADSRWLMGSTLHGPGVHELDVDVRHRSRVATVSRVELVGQGGAVVASAPGGTTPFRAAFTVDPASDAYFFARVVLENEATRLISTPIFVDR